MKCSELRSVAPVFSANELGDGSSLPTPDQVEARYQKRQERIETFLRRQEPISRAISWGRMLCFLLALGGVTAGFWNLSRVQIVPLILGMIGLLGFVGLMVWHEQVIQILRRMKALRKIQQGARWRRSRDWSQLVNHPVADEFAKHPVARDLDVFGAEGRGASLFSLIGGVYTAPGRAILSQWLLQPAEAEEIRARQQAVQELAPALDWRQELLLLTQTLAEPEHRPEPLLKFAESSNTWLPRRKSIWLVRALTAITLLSLALHVLGWLPPFWIAFAVFNLALSRIWGKFGEPVFANLLGQERIVAKTTELCRLLADTQFDSPWLQRAGKVLTVEQSTAYQQLKRLSRLAAFAEIRLSVFVYLPLQALTLWDFHLLGRLEGWRQSAGAQMRAWIQALAEIEALAALAGLHHDHPDGCFAEISEADPVVLEAQDLRHPLLPLAACVGNDVQLGPAGSFLLVTGSNMSGKSTLMRAIGLNVILAQCGGPVFARAMVCPPLVLGTSFRIQDSVEQGVSYFMAELQRLKEIVDLAQATQQVGQANLLFLLDEILLGTNIFERQIAVRQVIRFLIDQGAVGAISTHDLSLADADELREQCQPVHFKESYQEQDGRALMHFDYRLRTGVASTANALKLLQLVGLGEGVQ